MASSKGIEQLKKDEGSRPKGYLDDRGVLTVGLGFNLEREDAREQLILAGVKPSEVSNVMKVGGMALTEPQIDSLFQNSLQIAESDMKSIYRNHETLPQTVKDTLINMSYQLGGGGLRKFKKMNVAVSKGDWKGMQAEMKDSEWNKQVPSRSNRLISGIGKVKLEPQKPITNVGKAKSAKELYDKQVFDKRAKQLASVMSRQAMIKQLAASMQKIEDNKPTTPESKPSIEPIQQEIVTNGN